MSFHHRGSVKITKATVDRQCNFARPVFLCANMCSMTLWLQAWIIYEFSSIQCKLHNFSFFALLHFATSFAFLIHFVFTLLQRNLHKWFRDIIFFASLQSHFLCFSSTLNLKCNRQVQSAPALFFRLAVWTQPQERFF